MLKRALKRVRAHTACVRCPGLKLIVLCAAAALAVLLLEVGFVLHRAGSALRESAQETSRRAQIPFDERTLSLTAPASIETIAAAPGYRDIALFRGSMLVSAAAGLYLYDSAGTLTRVWRTGLELPAGEPGAMSEGTAEVFIATRGAGLLAFNGRAIRQILPRDKALRNITAVLALGSGRVVFGTERRGALVYDGRHIIPLTSGLADEPVTALAGTEGDLWIGTLLHGVYRFHGGQLDALASALPDPQVLSIDASDRAVYVGTPLGVVEFQDGRRVRTVAEGVFARSVAAIADGLAVGTEDEGIVETRRAVAPSAVRGPVRSIRHISGEPYAVTPSDIYRFDAARGWREALTDAPDAALTSRNIAALGFSGGSLWVGYFDAGMDVLGPDLARTGHLEDDTLFCINRFVADPSGRRTAVATANGLVLFDAAGRRRQVLGRVQGLLSDHVTDVAFRDAGMVVATPAGISFIDNTGIRSLYVFEGLVNNHVYTLASFGRETVAGTLGGVSVLENDTVRANYTTANSGLRHNWVTAVARVGDDWFAGTYGAGVLRLGHDGQWTAFPDLRGGFIVNPGAMLVTARRVFAGSLGRGLFIFDRGSQRWSNLARGLPSLNVTALAEREGFLYVGTDNGLLRIAEEQLP